MKTTCLISAEGRPGIAGISGDDIAARSAERSTNPLFSSTRAVIAGRASSAGVSMMLSTPRMPRNALFGTSLPALGPLPKPRKQMQARCRPSGETATR